MISRLFGQGSQDLFNYLFFIKGKSPELVLENDDARRIANERRN